MSTDTMLVCLDHTPHVYSDDVANSVSVEYIEEIKGYLSNRDKIVESMVEFGAEYSDRPLITCAWFFRDHPKCRIAMATEYAEWIDLGMGLPRGEIKMWAPYVKVKKPYVQLIPKLNAAAPAKIEEIRGRDKIAVPRMLRGYEATTADTIYNEHVQAEMDRRYLLSLIQDAGFK